MSGISSVKPKVIIQRAATKIQAMFRSQQLLQAAKNGDIKRTENLIKHGAKINATNKNGETALYLATKCNHVKAVQLLLDNGADVNVKNKYGLTALHYAARMGYTSRGYEEIVKALVIAGADVNAKDSEGWTALHEAACYFFGNEDIIQALVIAGADVNATNNDGKTVLHWSMDRGYYKVQNAIEAGKKKLISLYENQQCQLKTVVNSPIHECESLREPLLQNKPVKLNETQIQQAIKDRKEKKLGTINSLIKIFFQV